MGKRSGDAVLGWYRYRPCIFVFLVPFLLYGWCVGLCAVVSAGTGVFLRRFLFVFSLRMDFLSISGLGGAEGEIPVCILYCWLSVLILTMKSAA